MTSLEIEHRGHTIRYSENEDVWRCYGIDFAHAKLSVVKAKVAEIETAERRLKTIVKALKLEHYSHRVTAVELMTIADDAHVWARVKGGKSVHRRKENLENLVLDTPENRELIAEFQRLYNVAQEAGKIADAAKAAIPTLTVEALKGMEPEGKS